MGAENQSMREQGSNDRQSSNGGQDSKDDSHDHEHHQEHGGGGDDQHDHDQHDHDQHDHDQGGQDHDQHDHGGHDHGGHDHGSHHEHMVEDFRRRFWISLVLTIPVLVLSPTIQGWLGLEQTLDFPGDLYVQLAISTVLFFYGGWPFLRGGVDEIRQANPGMMLLIALAIVVAYGYSAVVVLGLEGRVFFWELATLIDVMLLGHWIEMRSVMGASNALGELAALMPSTAHRLTESGDTEDISISELQPDDRVVVKPGEKVPADGRVVDGHTSIDQSLLTGESRPVEKGEGDRVVGGSINKEGSITVEVEQAGDETYLSQVMNLVRTAQQSRSRQQDVANRAARWLTFIAIAAGAITVTAWLWIGRDLAYSIERMATVMVITCPHALGLAVPLVVAIYTVIGARNGLLIRNRAAFESSRLIDAVVFDKTGTLTEGTFGVRDVVAFGSSGGNRDANDENGGDNDGNADNGGAADEVLATALAVESRSEHPLAQAIVAEAKQRELQRDEVSDFENMPGQGARGRVGDHEVKVVNRGYLDQEGIEVDDERADRLGEEGHTLAFVLRDGQPIGVIALGDSVRPESREAVEALSAEGIQIMMITGDSEAVARRVAEELGLDDYFAEVKPDDKADKIRELREQGLRVAMVGDGVNDAPALAEADVGIAIGAGTQVAVETADVVLVHDDPRDTLRTVRLAQATHRKMLQNLAWATGYNVIAIPLAAGVLAWAGIVLSPAVGALVMSASTVIVAINARLLRLDD